jgi:predicted DNA-binding protein with PD1-like motif
MASGGDLSPGCVVFSCELILQELAGPSMARALDPATGLSPLGPAQDDGA